MQLARVVRRRHRWKKRSRKGLTFVQIFPQFFFFFLGNFFSQIRGNSIRAAVESNVMPAWVSPELERTTQWIVLSRISRVSRTDVRCTWAPLVPRLLPRRSPFLPWVQSSCKSAGTSGAIWAHSSSDKPRAWRVLLGRKIVIYCIAIALLCK